MRIFIDALKLLTEDVVRVGNNEVRLYRNPSGTMLSKLVKNSKYGHMRGIVVGDDLYWWDAAFAIHGQIARELGAEDYRANRMHIELQDGDAVFSWDDEKWTVDKMLDHPGFRILLQSPKIFISAGSYGLLSGPEYVELWLKEG